MLRGVPGPRLSTERAGHNVQDVPDTHENGERCSVPSACAHCTHDTERFQAV